MQTTSGSLTIVNAHTAFAKVYWGGQLLPALEVFCHSPVGDDSTVRVKVDGSVTGLDDIYAAMIAAGIKVKKGQ